MEFASVGIAFVSVIAAVYFGIKSQRLEKKNTDLKKRLLEIEETRENDRKKAITKAQLRARIEDRGNHNYRLVVENTGNCEAQNIQLRMDGKPLNEHPAAVSGDSEISHIGPHSFATRLLGLTLKCSPPFDFEVTWEDESGQSGVYRTTLTI